MYVIKGIDKYPIKMMTKCSVEEDDYTDTQYFLVKGSDLKRMGHPVDKDYIVRGPLMEDCDIFNILIDNMTSEMEQDEIEDFIEKVNLNYMAIIKEYDKILSMYSYDGMNYDDYYETMVGAYGRVVCGNAK